MATTDLVRDRRGLLVVRQPYAHGSPMVTVMGWALLAGAAISAARLVVLGELDLLVPTPIFAALGYFLVINTRVAEVDPLARRLSTWWSLPPLKKRFFEAQHDLSPFVGVRCVRWRIWAKPGSTAWKSGELFWFVVLEGEGPQDGGCPRQLPVCRYAGEARASAVAAELARALRLAVLPSAGG